MKFFFPILFSASLLYSICAIAQNTSDSTLLANKSIAWYSANQTKNDSLIVKRYLNDTLGFTAFHNGSLLDSLIPNDEIKYWELNEIRNYSSWGLRDEDSKGDQKMIKQLGKDWENALNLWKNAFQYSNVYKTNTTNSLGDSIVLTKGRQGFEFSVPLRKSGKWYISAQKRNGQLLHIDTDNKLGYFIKNANNPYNAFFLLTHLMFEPKYTSTDCKYKAVQNGYLLMISNRIDDCPVTYENLLFYINTNKKETFIKLLRINNEGGCI